MDNPKVSVMCLAYNHQPYIRQALDGIFMQKTNFDYEVIIHDDASTDNTADIIRTYIPKHSQKINAVFQTENQYSKDVSMFMLLYPYCKGEYIAICEGDDYWTDPLKLQTQVDILDNHPKYSGCGHNVDIVDENSNPHNDAWIKKNIDVQENTIKHIKHIYMHMRLAHTCSLVFRKSLVDNIAVSTLSEYKSIEINDDNKLSALIAANGEFYHLNKIMACYRYVATHGDSWNARTQGKNLSFASLKGFLQVDKFLSTHYGISGLYEHTYNRLIRNAISFYLTSPTQENRDILTSALKIWSFL